VTVEIEHHKKHQPYEYIGMPSRALQLILRNVWTTPSVIATEVRHQFPQIHTNQIYYAWKKASEGLWMRNPDQMKSAIALLEEYEDEVEVFNIEPLEDVKMLAATCIKDVVEVAMDATCK